MISEYWSSNFFEISIARLPSAPLATTIGSLASMRILLLEYFYRYPKSYNALSIWPCLGKAMERDREDTANTISILPIVTIQFKYFVCSSSSKCLDSSRSGWFPATNSDNTEVYSSTVKDISVEILHLIAHQNNFKVLCVDVSNAFANDDTCEKVYFIVGREFGEWQVMTVIIRKAL